jgi:hypothetical protein
LRIANAERSETCCAVIDVTSDSNGSGASGGRRPAKPFVIGPRIGSAAAHA